MVTRVLAPFEHVNLQTALDAWSARPGRTVQVRGVALPPHYGGVSLQQLVAGEALPPLWLGAPALADLPNGPGSTLGCLRLALLLVEDDQGRYVVMVQGPSEHQSDLLVEVAGLPVAGPGPAAELDRLRAELNVYRGHLLEAGRTPMGGVSLTFLDPPAVAGPTSCCRSRCWAGSSGMPWPWPTTGPRWSRPASTSSAACCSTGRPGPARPTPSATCWGGWRLYPAGAHRPGR